MTLTLLLRNADTLPNGGPVQLVLDRRGAILGRSPTVDWSLPDPASVISSRHCEIRFESGAYTLTDTSTNGTLVNGAPLSGPHRLANDDVVTIGHYDIHVSLPDGFGGSASFGGGAAPAQSGWGGWDSHAGGGASPAAQDTPGWAPPQAAPVISGSGPLSADAGQGLSSPAPSAGWTSAAATPPPAPSDQGWGAAPSGGSSSPWDSIGTPPPPAPEAASGWSSAPGTPAPSSAADIWGRLEQSNDVDWAQGGFGVAMPAPPAGDSLGLGKPAADSLPAFAPPAFTPPSGAPAAPTAFSSPPPAPEFGASPAPASAPAPAPASAAPVSSAQASAQGDIAAPLARALGLPADAFTQGDDATLAAAAEMLRALVGGLVVMMAARARAKAQMGAQTTVFEFGGNNPLKFARTPEEALSQMLNPPERGFMPAAQAIHEAFLDLQSHQMATLKAMQGALKATLERFSPNAISQRSKEKGLLAQILPGTHDAALWRAYVKEFSGVAQGSDEAFMDVFSKEFRRAYEEEAAKGRR